VQAEVINKLRSEINLLKKEKNRCDDRVKRQQQIKLLNEKSIDSFSKITPQLSTENEKQIFADKEYQSNVTSNELKMNDDIVKVVQCLTLTLLPNIRDIKQREVLRDCTFKLKQIALRVQKLQFFNERSIPNNDTEPQLDNSLNHKHLLNKVEKTINFKSCVENQSNLYMKQTHDIKTIIDSSFKFQEMTDDEKCSFKHQLKIFVDDIIRDRKEKEEYKQMCYKLRAELFKLGSNTKPRVEVKNHCQPSNHSINNVSNKKEKTCTNKFHTNDFRKIGFSSTSRSPVNIQKSFTAKEANKNYQIFDSSASKEEPNNKL